MQKLGMKLIITGIFVIVLSGLEKILIFLAYQGKGVHDNIALKNLTPSIIWNVPSTTYSFGIIILICGMLLLIIKSNFLKRQIEIIKKKNEEFNKIHEPETLNKNKKY